MIDANQRKILGILGALAFVAAGAAGCDDDSFEDDPFVTYGYYYPGDLAFSDPYWVDDWTGISTFGSTVREPSTVSTTNTPAASLRSLALGGNVCPGHVTVTFKTAPNPCSAIVVGARTTIPAGATVAFDACEIEGGGRLDGSLDIDGTQTLSDNNCNAETIVSIDYTNKATDLVYTTPDGNRVVSPSLVRTGSFTRPFTGRPTTLTINTSGTFERHGKNGSFDIETAVTGSQQLTLDLDAGEATYSLAGTLSIQDTRRDDRTLTVTGQDVTRTELCCVPVAGTITVQRNRDDSNVFRFGPGCGDLTLNRDLVRRIECF